MKNFRVGIQKFGNHLSGMIMPNIGVFIAWGLITSFFIPVGWIPNEKLAELVGPILKYLLPILIGYSGGSMAYRGARGGVIGSISTMGVIVGAEIPMLLGAMIFGPLSGYILRKFDEMLEGKVKEGFEMLVNNFSLGIIGAALAVFGTLTVGPVVSALTDWLASGVDVLVSHKLLPLTSIFIEPAKVLFLNNAINHGILTPLGTDQVLESGKSILFLLEANPGPGLGILLAYMFFGKKTAKRTAPAAIIIHFFGGIHEIYFPFILMNPTLIIAAIGGGMSGIFTLLTLGGGLQAPASPGSFIAVMLSTPKGGYLSNIIAIAVATAVTFLIAMLLMKAKGTEVSDNLDEAKKDTTENKLLGKKDNTINTLNNSVTHIVFACDAGMGSSAMGATLLRKKLKKAGIDIHVSNASVRQLTSDTKVVVTQTSLAEQAKNNAPNAVIIAVDNFLESPEYDNIVKKLQSANKEAERASLTKSHIFLNCQFANKKEAIQFAGEKLVELSHVTPAYILEMHKRDKIASVAIGNGVAIPHGTQDSQKEITKSGAVFIQVPKGVNFDGQTIYAIFGIAYLGDDHVDNLAKIADFCSVKENVDKLATVSSKEEVLNMLNA